MNLVYDGKLRRCAEENRTEFNCTSCARPQGGSQGGFAATRGGFAATRGGFAARVPARRAGRRHADTRLRRARLCRDTRTRAQDRVHVPTTINIDMHW